MGRIAAKRYAALLLFVYLSVAMCGHVVALSCGCVMRHDRTACEAVDSCRHDCCANSSAQAEYRGERCCNHYHSTDVELYTQTRIAADASLRIMLQPLLSGLPCGERILDDRPVSFAYGLYLPPPLSGAYCACSSLRAPPAAV